MYTGFVSQREYIRVTDNHFGKWRSTRKTPGNHSHSSRAYSGGRVFQAVIVIWLVWPDSVCFTALISGQMVSFPLPQLIKSPLKVIVPAPHTVGLVPSTELGCGTAEYLDTPANRPFSCLLGAMSSTRCKILSLSSLLILGNSRVPLRLVILQNLGVLYRLSTTPDGPGFIPQVKRLWLTSIAGGAPLQIAIVSDNQVIASATTSGIGALPWRIDCSAKAVAIREITIYAGPLKVLLSPIKIQLPIAHCLRVFFFLSAWRVARELYAFTDGRSRSTPVQYGLWSLDLAHKPLNKPHQQVQVRTRIHQTLAPDGSTLLLFKL